MRWFSWLRGGNRREDESPVSPEAAAGPMPVSEEGMRESMPRGDSRKTGVYPTKALRHFSKVKWTYCARGEGHVENALAVARGVLMFVKGSSLYGIDVESGQEKWTTGVSYGMGEGLVTAGTSVFHTDDVQGKPHLISTDIHTGQVKWKIASEKGYPSSPVVAKAALYFGNNGRISAINASNGKKKWSSQSPDSKYVDCLALDGESLCCRAGDYIWGLDASSGSEQWRYMAGHSTRLMSPTIYQGIVYFAHRENRDLYRLDIKTGTNFDSLRVANGVTSLIAVDKGIAYMGDGLFYLSAIDINQNKRVWGLKMQDTVHTSPVIAEHLIYFGGTNHLHCVNLSTGQPEWKFETKTTVVTDPVVADGIVYFVTSNGYVYALE